MHRIILAATLAALTIAAGCEHECFDYYPDHETPTTMPDVVKSGPDYYGGRNSNTPIVIPGSTSTNPSATSTTSSGHS